MTDSPSPPPPGYHGRYLRVDCRRGTGEVVPLDAAVLRQYLGGAGWATALLREKGAERPSRLAEAALAFVFSPLVGSPLTTSAKFAVVSKSPLTGAAQRFAGQQPLRPRRQEDRLRRDR